MYIYTHAYTHMYGRTYVCMGIDFDFARFSRLINCREKLELKRKKRRKKKEKMKKKEETMIGNRRQ